MLALMASHDHHAAAVAAESEAISVRRPGSALSPALDSSSVSLFQTREDLFLEDDDASHVYEVLSGVVCAYRLLADGQRHVVSFYFPGDLIGYCCIGSYAFSAQALSPVRARRIPRSSIDRMIESRPEFARRLLRLAAEELSATREQLVCLASKSAEAKMAAFLLALSRRNQTAGEDPARIQLPMTRIDIGDYLGLTIETVSRSLSKLKRADIIALPRTSTVVIRSLERLEAIAQA